MAGVAWLGQDGNIYTKASGQKGVVNIGSASGTGFLLAAPGSQYKGLDIIRDPMVPAPQAQAQPQAQQANQFPAAAAAAPAGPARPSQAQIDPLTAALGSLDTVRTNNINAAQSTFDQNMRGYQEENALDKENYGKQVSQNESNLTSGRMASLIQAAQGGMGLRSILASLGALSGTGSQLADEAIASAANKDVGEVDNTFKANADSLNTAWSDTERKQRQRDADARAALENDKRAAESNFFTNKQGILTQLANLFGPDSNEWKTYASESASLYPSIAANTQKSVAAYQPSSPLYSKTALDTYKGGVQDLTVGTKPGGSGNDSKFTSPLFAFNKRREEELA